MLYTNFISFYFLLLYHRSKITIFNSSINILKLSLQWNNLPLFVFFSLSKNIIIKKLLLKGVFNSFDQDFINSLVSPPYFIFFLFRLTTRAILRLLFIYRDVVSPRKEKIIVSFYVHSYRTFSPREKNRILLERRSKIARPSCVPTMISCSKKLAH